MTGTAGETGSRLIYGVVDGRRRSRIGTAAAVAAAMRIDQAMGLAGLARPVLLVSGFWRSGTTWVQEMAAAALGAKTVFEPLSPQDPTRRAALAAALPGAGEDRLQATIPGPCAGRPFWRDLDRAATGRTTSPFLLSCRGVPAESLRTRIVLKDVRLQANLGAAHHRYAVPVLHVRRHPCAVVASLIAAHWHWSFDRVRLVDILPALGDAAPSPATLDTLDNDAASRIAALWAVTERLAEQALAGQSWGLLLRYEALLDGADAAVGSALAGLGLQPGRPVDGSRPSASVHPLAFAGYNTAPHERWRSQLTPETIDRVEAIADTLHPGWRESGA